MNWHAALHDPIFKIYCLIIAALLVAGGIILALLQFVLHKNLANVWPIWRSWLIMAPLGLGVVGLGREATILGVILLCLFAFQEFARATTLAQDRAITFIVHLAILGIGASIWIAPTSFPSMPIYAGCAIWLVPIIRNRVTGQLRAVALAILGFVCIGWLPAHLALLTRSHHPYGYIAFIVFAVEITDISAYTFGKLFGRRPFRSQISPNKTWGGAIGSLAVALALPWVLAFSFPPQITAPLKLLIGLIVGLGSQLGDLAISLIKRDLGIKDMGATIPGHGGILDRIDSLLFTTPLFVILINRVDPFL